MSLIPDFVVGGAGFGGSPVAISWLPLGTKLGGMFAAIARITNNEAQIQSENAALDNTEAGWIRRLDEWVHQIQILTIEIQQAERQILGAQRRRDQALMELNTHQRQIENGAEVQNFLRDKFTSHELYLYLQKRDGGTLLPDVRPGPACRQPGATRVQFRTRAHHPAFPAARTPGILA